MTASVYIALAVLGVLTLFLIAKAIKSGVERRRFRRRNREYQYSGTAQTDVPRYRHRSWSEAVGDRGERRVASYLEDLPYDRYSVYNDLLFRNRDYTTQVDHLIVSKYGIFVIETKNVHGKVYGSGNAEFWKQYLPDIGYRKFGNTQEHQLRNPLWQNGGHIKALRRLVFGNDAPIVGVVVFPNDTDLYVTADSPVLHMWEIVSFIDSFQNEVLSLDQVEAYRQRIMEVISTSGTDREQHLENVWRSKERRDAAVTEGRCPLCGGTLVLRNGRYGQFYGCSNYPRCTYILNS